MHVVYAHGLGQKPDSWDAVLTVLDETIESSCPDLFALCNNSALTYPNLYARFKAYCHDMEGPLQSVRYVAWGCFSIELCVGLSKKSAVARTHCTSSEYAVCAVESSEWPISFHAGSYF